MGELLQCSFWRNPVRCQNIHGEPRACLLWGHLSLHWASKLAVHEVHLYGLSRFVMAWDDLLMIFLHFVCKLLSNPREHRIAAMLSEVFGLRLLSSKNQFVHPFLTDVIITFSRAPGPIHEVRFRNKLCQLPLEGVTFSITKVLYNISCLSGLVISQCPAHFPGTCPRLFIDGHNAQLHCIKMFCSPDKVIVDL